MARTVEEVEADRALKAKHRAMWGLGDYPTLAREIIPELGRALVEACQIRPGQRVLDVAAGAGNAAIPAAQTGADVVACDLSPALLAAGQAQAEAEGVTLQWQEADAEALPFADEEFDTVLSCLGVMFAPHHQAAAHELLRVCRPGGTVGLVSWTPEGFIGQLFAVMRPYAPAPPPGAQPPPLWGKDEHVRALLGEQVTDVVIQRQFLRVDRFQQPEEFREYFKTRYGPTIVAYRGIAEDPERVRALDRDIDALARRHLGAPETTSMAWEYLLLVARKRG